jgi:hypothetical protein
MVGVVFEDQGDTDFGEIITCPADVSSFEENLAKIDLSHLEPRQQTALIKLLRKYQTVFNDSPGTCNVGEHEVNLRPDFTPKAQRPYRIPYKLQQEVDRQTDQLLKDGKIKLSCSPYAHPIVCVYKPNGDVRICGDFRYVNSGTIEDRYPMPRADDLLLRMSSANFLTTVDASSGYHQIKCRSSDTHLYSFVTHSNQFEYLVMPFGARCAGNTYQRIIDTILRPCSGYSHSYVDDTSIFSDTFLQHLDDLESVLRAFEKAGMTLKMSKCAFAKPKVKFVGHLVGSGERLPLLDKLKAIRDIAEPTTKKQVRSFVGLLSFYRIYINSFAELSAVLSDMTKKSVKNKFTFGDKERKAFQALKDALCNVTALQSPDYSKEFVIHSDSSDISISACLSQYNVDNTALRPIAFVSKKLSDTQKRWAVVERECYATIYALQTWDVLLFGCKIILFTDSSPLAFIASAKTISSKMCRWSLVLQRYNIEVRHIPGSANGAADCLSRSMSE